MSDTPRTDDESFFVYHSRYDVCRADVARQLERELNAANQRIKRLEEYGHQLFLWLDRNTPVTVRNDWIKAKEAKP